jgi:hypothetical protein
MVQTIEGESRVVADDPAAPAAVPTDTLVKIYRKIRDTRSNLKKQYEEDDEALKSQLAKIATALKQRVAEIGESATGLKTEYGTVYLAETMKVSCGDWGVFYSWAKEHDCLENFLEQRIKQGEVKAYMDKTKGELPPGVSVFREIEARVRAPKKPGVKALESDE